MTLEELNALDDAAFVDALAGIFEHSPWVAARVQGARPFATVEALHTAMAGAMYAASEPQQLALLRAHPELAGKAMVRDELTRASTGEQSGAGLTQCSPDELARLQDLNRRYRERFDFPFILAVKGLDRGAVIREFTRRVEGGRAAELSECLAQVARIARFRLAALLPE